MKKILLATDGLPAGLDDNARYHRWQEVNSASGYGLDMARLLDRPFNIRWEALRLRDCAVGRGAGTVAEIRRTRRHLNADKGGDFFICFNVGGSGWQFSHHGREGNGTAVFGTYAETSVFRAISGIEWVTINIPRASLGGAVADVEDLIGRPIDPAHAMARHLGRYLQFLIAADEDIHDPRLTDHVRTTLVDLATLAVGSSGDAVEIARTRGLRSARLREVLAAINNSFDDPAFSTERVAFALGVSRRYVNDLLYESGATLAERVLELRLQKARTMLSSPRNDHLKIGEIALSCGFNEVSYFNRCFRRRFGLSPTACRGGA